MRALWIALLVVGCAVPKPWAKPNGTPQQAQQDERECDYEAAKATANILNGFEAGWQKASLRMQCMETRGYRR